ncbi:NlpC/P60 family protein [Actinomadura xylanilytica]|uniref:NlpC/P60 family protein n=1 Tax=Actinomadura xylanilytica TaxID=887459 RepID=UPI00255AE88C|nr:NlpC/P60 family protein [Actinomadura xylanilytica]MDL4773999.1 NlpC/P60 family protein [Actinomadura xylanilytica]
MAEASSGAAPRQRPGTRRLRSACAWWTSGPHVSLRSLRAGDLVFFAHDTSEPDTIHHVGIFIGATRALG